ncbi:MAG: hypothetical protein Unbinned15contig1001_27 [Prokaryotic dsDNA virus sp.]|nr:MAG: hypothetical protein Unbinned15contig1001_27 [Prokaryotic dsDNA virus sp.]|tara:strand:+ start:14545 stop:14685 length:141 start_codon:yes stop_codon:yes gene_type:complete
MPGKMYSPKQMKIAKASGNPNKIEASDFTALKGKKKRKFTKKKGMA